MGLHSGEVTLHDADIAGMAVNIAARVSALGDSDDVVVSQTVRDMVIGSGLAFNSKGRHRLKGVPGEWEVFRVDSGLWRS